VRLRAGVLLVRRDCEQGCMRAGLLECRGVSCTRACLQSCVHASVLKYMLPCVHQFKRVCVNAFHTCVPA
jgi:hypothetical protein